MRKMVTEAADHPEYVTEIREMVLREKGVEAAIAKMEGHLAQSLASLDILPDSQAKERLKVLARFVIDRKQ